MPGFYEDSTDNLCKPCTPPCKECLTSGIHCINCSDSSYRYLDTTLNECHCQDGYVDVSGNC